MATIQIRDIPDEVHEQLSRQAKASGQSLQKYMREHVIDLAHATARRVELLVAWEHELATHRPSVTREQILDDLDELRGA